jgi:hypothetical protein
VVASCYLIDYAASFGFPVPPAQMWAAISRLDRFESWWGWLGDLEVVGESLQTGSVLRGTVSPPVPYRMTVDVELTKCVPGELIDATVRGDLVGDAHLSLRPTSDGTVADVAWLLEMRQFPMRVAARVAYPFLRWGHDRVVMATVAAFRSQLLKDPPAA